ncbi:MAG: hypothetical protein GPI95_24320 [Microcystis aeruginosa LG13-11]|jgi:hypothetical protein|nr:hypothetical protein [Microcystis aeruginosa LG13-11]
MAKIEPEGRRGKVGVIVAIAIPLFCLLGLIVYTQTVEPIVQVELDVFSGRPNPHWTLNQRDSQELLRRLQRLSPTNAGEPSGNLGYRGVILSNPEGAIAGFEWIVCSNGLVVGYKGDSSQKFIDANRNLERWLVQTGETTLGPDILRSLRQEFGGDF